MSSDIFHFSTCTKISFTCSFSPSSVAPRRARPRLLKVGLSSLHPEANRPQPRTAPPQQGKLQPPGKTLLRLTCCQFVNHQLVDINGLSNHRSSGKKATPPTVKANMESGGKAPPRSGTRISARLSQEVLPPNGNSRTSPGQSEPRKRAPAGTKPIRGQEIIAHSCFLLLNTRSC